MIFHTAAKINIGLQVIEKRPDGFHNLSSVFYPIPFSDVIEYFESDICSVSNFGLALNIPDQENIILKAYYLLKNIFPHLPALKINLLKNVPFGAGLGGGSADATFFIKSLNAHYQLGLSETELEKISSQIGSDCAFFVKNKAAYILGKGDTTETIALDLSRYQIQLICTDIFISTALAFKNCIPNNERTSIDKLITEPINTWKDLIENDFEKSVFPSFPLLAAIKNQLYEQGALYASMSGSGSAIYGIFPKNKKANIRVNTGFKEFIF